MKNLAILLVFICGPIYAQTNFSPVSVDLTTGLLDMESQGVSTTSMGSVTWDMRESLMQWPTNLTFFTLGGFTNPIPLLGTDSNGVLTLNLADGAATPATYAPTGYVAVATNTISEHLAGIDAALGASAVRSQEEVAWIINGPINDGDGIDGIRAFAQAGQIVSIVVTAIKRKDLVGTPATFDINLHVPTKPITTARGGTTGTTVYTTQGNRPTIVGDAGGKDDNYIFEAILPDVVAFAAGDFFTMDIDEKGDSPEDVRIQLFVQYD